MTSPTSSIKTVKREPGRHSPSPNSPREGQTTIDSLLPPTSVSGIPIPRMPSTTAHSSSSVGALGIRTGERERGVSTSYASSSYYQSPSHHATSARSPSGSSLSSHRSHPYSRRTSFSALHTPPDNYPQPPALRDPSRDLPRIHLPPPPGSASLMNIDPAERMAPPLASLVIQSPPERPIIPRTASGGSNGKGIQLPSLHALTGAGISPTGLAHPHHSFSPRMSHIAEAPIDSPRNNTGRGTSPGGQYPLRPSYSYEHYPPSYPPAEYDRPPPLTDPRHGHPEDYPSSRQHRASEPGRYDHDLYPPSSRHSHHGQVHEYPQPSSSHRQSSHSHQSSSLSHPHERSSHHSSSSSRRISPEKYGGPPSPPLRPVPPELRGPTPQPHQAYYPSSSSGGYRVSSGRSRSQSHSSTSIRGQQPALDPNVDHGPGQNRRLAHLMSEQKRRESINSGFTALRSALPNSIPTDSKAIILRKAVSHINHIEALLRKAGVNSSGGIGGPVLTPSSWDEEHDRGESYDPVERHEQGDIEMEDDRRGWQHVQHGHQGLLGHHELQHDDHGVRARERERQRERHHREGEVKYRTMPSTSGMSRRRSRQ